MKRIAILIVILIVGWFLVNRSEQISSEEEKNNEEEIVVEVSTEEAPSMDQDDSEVEVMVDDEDKEKNDDEDKKEVAVADKDVSQVSETSLASPLVVRVPEKKKVPLSFSPSKSSLPYSDYVKVYLYEWEMDVSKGINEPLIEGKIRFEVTNTGRLTHNFGILGVQDFGKIVPGETREFSAVLDSGQFDFYSSKEVDMNRGMGETVVVQ